MSICSLSLSSSRVVSTRLVCHVLFMVLLLVLSVSFVSAPRFRPCLVIDRSYVPLREFLVFQVSILKREAFLFPLTPFFIVEIDVGTLKEHREELVLSVSRSESRALEREKSTACGSAEGLKYRI